MRLRGCIISIHFSVTTGGQSLELVVVEKTDMALGGKEGHLREGQSEISENTNYVRKKHTIISSK